ncbi:MAG: carbohydrate binding domain-containing protein [Lachnospiraceae bacterium]|nr:carbohydrate binding domain-containing protein [Lachnospiraceae bacterium]
MKMKKAIAAALALAMTLSLAAPPAGAAPISAAKAKVTSVKITKPDTTTLVIKKNKTYQLKVSVKGTGKVSKKVTYTSSNSKVVKVSKKGKLKAVKNGTAKITVKSKANPKKKAVLTVKVGTPVTKVKLNKKTLQGEEGTVVQLKATVSPAKATLKKVSYKSSNPKVASVDSKGHVKLVKKGTAKITVTSKDGNGKKAVCKITVVEKADATTTETPTEATTATPTEATTATPTEATTATPTETPTEEPTEATTEEAVTIPSYDDFELKWEDDFDGETLNEADWNYETHEKGWVNSELQAYVKSDDNIYLDDGNLVIKPVKTGEGDDATYTSGRINTQGKHDFTYGRFEARVKVPEGKGYLPAFWMMPTNESVYGQWPRCGEIDIMEVMGQETNKAYGTIHFGNPHAERQGTKVLAEGDYASEWHVFTVDWEPGKITWYVDGVKYHEASDWHSTTEGQGTVSYPAPFDQPFYMILNLAVGGSWVGYPDETTDFENQTFMVDYVRAYQKTDGYSEEGVEKPEKVINWREPFADGNLVYNGNFQGTDILPEGASDWEFGCQKDGEAVKEVIADDTFGASAKAAKITTTAAGTEDYSVQFMQAGIQLQQGYEYTVSFDAYAQAARTMIVDISAPDVSFKRYLQDTTVSLGTDKQTYTYTFKMESESDGNGRLEFNLGNTSPTDDVFISNVSVKKGSAFTIDTSKKVLADGNAVYNGKFQEGRDRMEYWDIVDEGERAVYGVTSLEDGRRLKVASTGCTDAGEVQLKQTGLPLLGNSDYVVSFEAALDTEDADITKEIHVTVAGQKQTFTLTNENQTYSCKITIGESVTDSDIVFDLGVNATVLLDNVRVEEDSLIKNGSFNAGEAGYEVYAYTASDVSHVVDSQKADNAMSLTIKNTGDADWKIQLKQNNVTLEEGKWYKLSLDARCDIARDIMYTIQRDGSKHDDDWTPYTDYDAKVFALEARTSDKDTELQHSEIVFQMTEPTDTEAILSISMGAVGGKQITEQHTIWIDNIVLEETEEPEKEPVTVGENILQNLDFTSGQDGMDNWEETINEPAEAEHSIKDGKISYTITNAGTDNWHVQLKQTGLALEAGETYQASFKATSTATREILTGVMSEKYAVYGDATVSLAKDEEQEVKFTFTMSEDDTTAQFYVSMGKMGDEDAPATPASTITLSDFSLVKVIGGESENLFSNGDFSEGADGLTGWSATVADGLGSCEVESGKLIYNLIDLKNALPEGHTLQEWDTRLTKTPITLTEGKKYRLTFKITSSADRKVKYVFQDPKNSYKWFGGEDLQLTAGKEKTVSYVLDMTQPDLYTCNTIDFLINLGAIDEYDNTGTKTGTYIPEGEATITLSDFSLTEVAETAE